MSLNAGDVQWTEFTQTRDSIQQGVTNTLFRYVEPHATQIYWAKTRQEIEALEILRAREMESNISR